VIPPPALPSQPPPPRQDNLAMSIPLAAAWAFGAMLVFTMLAQLTVTLRPGAEVDIISLFACQSVAYGVALFGILRVHAPQSSIRELLGFRGTHPAFYVLGPALGLAITVPAHVISSAIDKRWPDPEIEARILEIFAGAGAAKVAALSLVLAVLGPMLEEAFFRGALLQPLRRRYGGLLVILMTSVLFALAHVDWRIQPPLVLIGLVLGLLRVASGSIIPSVLLHGTFNAVTVVSLIAQTRSGQPPTDEPIPLLLGIGATAATLLLVFAARSLGGRSLTAKAARERDER
jgi:uncharacterized protein